VVRQLGDVVPSKEHAALLFRGIFLRSNNSYESQLPECDTPILMQSCDTPSRSIPDENERERGLVAMGLAGMYQHSEQLSSHNEGDTVHMTDVLHGMAGRMPLAERPTVASPAALCFVEHPVTVCHGARRVRLSHRFDSLITDSREYL
jgi:hypothetical protein